MGMKLLLVHRITSMLAACYESLHRNTLLSVHKNYHMHDCMLQLLHGNDIDCFGLDFVSSRFCRVLCNLSFHPCPHLSWICGFYNLLLFSNCSCILVLNCDPHACRGQNMFFYNCSTCKKILIIVLNKMQSLSVIQQVYSKTTNENLN